MRTKILTGINLHTPYGSIGYCYKDKDQPGYMCRMSPLITPEILLQARREYLTFGNLADKGVCYLSSKNLFDKTFTFKRIELLPDDISIQSVIVLMLRTRLFRASQTLICNTSGPIHFERAEALWCVLRSQCRKSILALQAKMTPGAGV